MRRLHISTLIGCFSSAALAFAPVGCGKDKPEPAAEASADASEEKPGEKADEDASATKESPAADVTPERPRRPIRDKNGTRRPPPVKQVGADAETPREGGVDAVGGATPPVVVGMTPDVAGPGDGGTGVGLSGTPDAQPAGPTGPTMVSDGIPGIPLPEPAPPTPNGPAVPEQPAIATGQASRDAETLLPLSVVLEQLGGVRLTAQGAIPGIAVRPGYSSVLYARADGTKFGVSLQVWQDGSRNDSEERYRRMRIQYPNGEEVSVLAPAKAFYSQFKGVQSMTFVDSVTRTVVSVACGEGVCTHEQLTKLAKAIRARF